MSSADRKSVKDALARGIRARYRKKRIFAGLGFGALLLGLAFLAFFFYTIVANGYTAFRQTQIRLAVELDAGVVDPDGRRARDALESADYLLLARNALREIFPGVTSREELGELYGLLRRGAGDDLRALVMADPALVGTTIEAWLVADDDVDVVVKGHVDRALPESDRRLSDRQLAWLEQLEAEGRVALKFNRDFFTSGASSDPEIAGI